MTAGTFGNTGVGAGISASAPGAGVDEASPGAGGDAGTAFSPSDIAGLKSWHDYSDATLLFQLSNGTTAVTANSDPIGYVTDKSGNGFHIIQATAGKRPLYKTGIFGSMAAGKFDQVDDFLDAAAFTLNQPNTVFAVVKLGNAAMDQQIIDGISNRCSILNNGGVTQWAMFAGGLVNASASDTNAAILIAQFSGAASTFRKDGGADADGGGNPSTDSIGGLRVGIDTGGVANPYGGHMGELIIYDTALSVANINLVGQYLATKFGTTWTTAT